MTEDEQLLEDYSKEIHREYYNPNKNMTVAELIESHMYLSEKKKGKNNPSYGKKCWNDGCGNIKRSVECPGNGWVPGMGKRKRTLPKLEH